MAIAFVQSKTAASSAAVTTQDVVLDATPTAGNILILSAAILSAIGGTVSSTGVVWEYRNVVGPSSTCSLLAIGRVLSGASATITVTPQSSGGVAIAVAEYSGAVAWFDQAASNTGSATQTVTTGTSGTTSHANQLWVAGLAFRYGTSGSGASYASPTNSFTIRAQAATSIGSSSDRIVALLENIVSSTGTAATGATISGGTGTNSFAAQVITLEATPAAGGASPIGLGSPVIRSAT